MSLRLKIGRRARKQSDGRRSLHWKVHPVYLRPKTTPRLPHASTTIGGPACACSRHRQHRRNDVLVVRLLFIRHGRGAGLSAYVFSEPVGVCEPDFVVWDLYGWLFVAAAGRSHLWEDWR